MCSGVPYSALCNDCCKSSPQLWAGDSLLGCHLFCVPLRGTRHLCGDWPVATDSDPTDKELVAGRPGGRVTNGRTILRMK